MTTAPLPARQLDARSYLRVLRAHWLGVVTCAVLGVLVAAGWSLVQPRVYEASSTGIVRVEGADDLGSLSVANTIAQAKVTSFVDLGTWREVAQRAADDLGLDAAPESLVHRVSVMNPEETTNLLVRATASAPAEAQALADAWIRALAAQIAEIEQGSGVMLVPGDSAQLPTSPSSPNVRLALILGGLVGLALGIVYALLRYVFDRRIRSVEQVEDESGVSVVGSLPKSAAFGPGSRLVGLGDARTNDDGQHAMGEALRILRTNIEFIDVDKPPRAIVVTSPLPGDGKSTVSANLALMLAAAGQDVVLLDGDLRRPTVAATFGLPNGAGVTDALAGRAELADVAQRIEGHPHLVVITAGRIPPNPAEVLGSHRMRDLVALLSEEAIVVIDAPPLLPVTDAAVLASNADGALIVASTGKTTVEVLRLALARLERVRARALGVVLIRVPTRGSGASYYGYQYRGGYERADAPDAVADLTTVVGNGRLPRRRRVAVDAHER